MSDHAISAKDMMKNNLLLSIKLIKNKDFVEDFKSQYLVEDGCWNWIGYIDDKGYGVFRRKHKGFKAHRISFLVAGNNIPDGLVLDHICRNRKCVRPDHLRAITQRENILCGTGRAAIGAKQTHCIRGHEFTLENTRINKARGERSCRTCRNAYLRDRRKQTLCKN